jgi:nucleoside-diphosphate-sugar epimerase
MLRLLRLVDSGMPLPFAGVDNRRSLLAIDNLCDFIAVALVNPAAAGETFLVSDQSAVSTTEMIIAMADALRRPARLVHVPPAILHLLGTGGPLARARDRLFGSFLLDTTKAKTDLGWVAPVSLDDALERMARWYCDNVRG